MSLALVSVSMVELTPSLRIMADRSLEKSFLATGPVSSTPHNTDNALVACTRWEGQREGLSDTTD